MVEGVSGEGIRRRRREYTEEPEETGTEELAATEVSRDKLRTRENSESDEQLEVSVSEAMEQAIRELQEEERREKEVSEKLKEALDDLEMEEQEGKPTGEKLKEALDELEIEEQERKPTGKKLREVLEEREEKEPSEPENQLNGGPTYRYGEISSKEDFDRALEKYPETELRKDFEERYRASESYFDGLESGEEPAKPDLVEEIEQKELRRRYEEENGGPPDVKIESMEDVNRLMEEQFDETSKTSREYQSAKTYFAIRDESGKSQHQLAEEYGVSQSTISNCQRGVETGLVKRLREREEERIIREWVDSHEFDLKSSDSSRRKWRELSIDESGLHRVQEWVIKEAFQGLRESKEVNRTVLEDALEKMLVSSSEQEYRMRMSDLSDSGLTPEELAKVKSVLEEHRAVIQDTLEQRTKHGKVRIGIVCDRIYVWTPDITPNDMINAWNNQYFYMNSRDMSEISDKTSRQLGLGDSRRERLKNLNDMMRQLMDNDPVSDTIKIDGDRSRMRGEVLRIQCDVLGIRNSDLRGRVTKVTGENGHGGISNPKFPEGQRLESARARLMATAYSDCHIRLEDSIVEYHEGNIQRIEQLIDQTLQEFGDFANEPVYVKRDRIYRLKLPSPYGRALNEWGVPSGDKTILNPGLPAEVGRWSPESVVSYKEDMIAEEGNVSPGRISWSRSSTLHNGIKSESYGSKNLISESEINLIRERGIVYEKNLNGEITLLYSKIVELRSSSISEEASAADRLFLVIRDNPNNLILGEKKLAERLGIKLSVKPANVVYFPETDRVSVKWSARTSMREEAIRWGLVCPPNHPQKREELKNWILKQNVDDVRKIVNEVEEDGISIHSMWRDYFK